MFKLKDQHHSALSTIIWNMRWTRSISFWLSVIGMVIANAAITVIGTLIPAITVQMLSNRTKLPTIALTLIGVGLALAVSQWLMPIMTILTKSKAFETQMLQLNKYLYDSVTVPFAWTLDPHYQESRASINRFGLQGMDSGTRKLSDAFIDLLQSALSLIILLVSLLVIKWWLPILIFVIGLISDRLQRWQHTFRANHRNAIYGDYSREDYVHRTARSETASKDIRLYDFSATLTKHYNHATNHEEQVNADISRRQFWQESSIIILNAIRDFATYFSLLRDTITGALSIAGFTYAFNAVSTVSTQINLFLNSWGDLTAATDDVDAVRNLFSTEDAANVNTTSGTAQLPNKPLPITFTHVSYRYPGAEHDTISDLSFTIPAGASIALVGLNGAGKSTLTNLMLGLLEPTSGTITLGANPVSAFSLDQYWQYFAPVFQTSDVFADTVAANVAMNKNPDTAKVNAAIKSAGLAADVAQLANGIDTQLTHYIHDDGVALSGGQTQKLMLARALYRNAPVVILDEPTAALDAIAESNIYQQYKQLMRGKTSIFISHRLASTQFADEIIFMKHGQITERGSHEQLLQAGKDYAQLFAVQSQYYAKEEAADAQ